MGDTWTKGSIWSEVVIDPMPRTLPRYVLWIDLSRAHCVIRIVNAPFGGIKPTVKVISYLHPADLKSEAITVGVAYMVLGLWLKDAEVQRRAIPNPAINTGNRGDSTTIVIR